MGALSDELSEAYFVALKLTKEGKFVFELHKREKDEMEHIKTLKQQINKTEQKSTNNETAENTRQKER